jgi:hypothetical protein
MSITTETETDTREKERHQWLKMIILIGVLAVTIFVVRSGSLVQAAPSPSDSLEQCSNEPTTCDSMNSKKWITGNLNANNSGYAEGDAVAYRATYTRLAVGETYMVTIDWDSTEGGRHAMDYLTSFNFSEMNADPCSGLSCSSPTSTLPIADDPMVASAGVNQADGQVFTAFGAEFPLSGAVIPNTGNLCGASPSCTISSNPSAYTTTGMYSGTSSTRVSVYFTAQSSTVVLAWGGHIASPMDWGMGKAASGINGSSYHMRLKGFACSNVSNCSSGNMDRSLSSSAVQITGSIVITKVASVEGNTEFPFTASPSPLTNFTLIDDGTETDSYVFSGLVEPEIFTISESSVEGWDFDSASCMLSNANGGKWEAEEKSVIIDFRIGESYNCTFTNTLIPVVTTTTVPETTTTVPETTTTVPETTTTVPETTTTVPVATVIAVVTTTTAPAVVTTTTAPAVITTTTAPVELQVVTPENPNGTQDALDVLFPDVLPSAGNDSANSTLVAMVLLFGGALLLTILTARRTRRN